MTRWKYIGATVLLFIALILNRILIEGKYTTSSSLGVLALILFFVASWKRARFLGYSTGKCIQVYICHHRYVPATRIIHYGYHTDLQ